MNFLKNLSLCLRRQLYTKGIHCSIAHRENVPSRAKCSTVSLVDPELYQSAHDVQKRDNRRVMQFFINALSPNLSETSQGANALSFQVLDIGCGSGDTTLNIILPAVNKCQRIIATDVSSKMIAFAAEVCAHKKINYDVCNVACKESMSRVSRKYGDFDCVFSFYTLHWVRDLSTALRNIRSVMSPNGECLLTFVTNNPTFIVNSSMAHNPKWSKFIEGSHLYEKDTFKGDSPIRSLMSDEDIVKNLICKMDELGVSVRTCELLHSHWKHESTETLRNNVLAICPFYHSIPKELENEFQAEIIDEYMKLSNGTNNYKYTLVVLHGVARS